MYKNFLQFNDKKFNKWLIVLVIILIVIIIAAVILVLILKKEQKPLVNINAGQNGVSQEELIRHGRMSLRTLAGDVVAGEILNVDILMDTQNSNIVVASADIIYDSEILELITVDTKNSALLMSIVKEEKLGEVEIMRGAPGDADYDDTDDGYTGSNGILASLEFKTLKSPLAGAEAEIKFNQEDSGMILDDGRGSGMVVDYSDLVVDVQ